MDVGPFLGADAAWKSTFYPDIFARITTDDGRILGIPEQRDVAGIFYNTELFSKAGVATFPQTWDEFNTDAAKLKEAGTIPFASAPNWVPLLLWSHRVGTEEGGPDFLLNGITQGNYAANPAVVTATEWLRDFYADGYVNKDAFSGDFPVARTPFIQGQAAMITNGPWMVNADIKSTEAQPDLATKIGYEPAPGDGLIIIGGDAAWVSAAKPEKAEAVAAFLKFSTTPEQQFARTLKTGSYGPTQVEFTADQKAQLEPLALSLVERSATARTYTHALGSASSEFDQAWRNNWPAYVQGQMTTTEFLNSLSAG
jgi:raffinose/stachyose/melibiose transport system substrate-binding protein